MTYPTDQEIADQSNDDWLNDYNGKTVINGSARARKPLRQNRKEFMADTLGSGAKSETFADSANSEEPDNLLPPPLLEPGSYIGLCTGWRLCPYRKGEDKLFFTVEVQIGNGKKIALERWYNVKALNNPEQGAGFEVHLRSSYRREFIAVFPEAVTRRLDRFFPKFLVGLKLNVRVRSTTYDMKREAIPEGAQYSVIGKILSIAD